MRALRGAFGLLALLGAVTMTPTTHANGPKPMSFLDLVDLSRAYAPQLSPDGKFLTYELSHADWTLGRPVWQLWRQEVGGGAPVQLTFGAGGINQQEARWSPDGKTILFLRGGQIWLMSADGGEARELTKHAPNVAGGTAPAPSWSPDGSAIYFVAADPSTAEERERTRLKDDVYSQDEDYKQRHLWKVVVSTGGEQRITTGESTVTSYHLSADGKRIVLERAPTPLTADNYRAEVWVMDANGENARILTHNDIYEDEPQFSPDNSQVLFVADASPKLEAYHSTRLFVVPASGAAPPKVVSPDFPYATDRAAWTPDGKSIIVVAFMGVHSELFQIDAGGHGFKQLTDGDHAIPPAPAAAWQLEPHTKQMVYLLDEPTRFGEVWTLPLTGGTPTRITNIYETLATTYALPRQERVEWKADGATIDGLLFYPADYQVGKTYPLIVQMHGGPQEGDRFGAGAGLTLNYFPVLTGKGYMVLRPNYRGSIGYGDDFMRGIVGGYFAHQHTDVMAGIDSLITKGLADPDRLIAMGWSAGGTLTNKLITFTDRFKVASSGAGISNWISLYAQTDTRANRTVYFGATPWQKNAPIDLYWNSSPLKDVSNVKTPTLFFAGERDPRVPMAQSVEMYRALKSNKVATQLWVAPGEGHGWGDLRHLLRKANTELEWFEKYAMGRPYTWEKAP